MKLMAFGITGLIVFHEPRGSMYQVLQAIISLSATYRSPFQPSSSGHLNFTIPQKVTKNYHVWHICLHVNLSWPMAKL